MQQAHLEWPFIVGSKAEAGILEILPHIGLEPDAFSRLFATGRTRLDKHAIANVACDSKFLYILETVVATEAADGLAFFGNEGECRMHGDGVSQLLQFTVNGVFTECRIVGSGIEKDVHVFRKPLDQVPAF